jgi:zinc protease
VAFEHAIEVELEPVPAGKPNTRPPRPAAAVAGTDATISADVGEPSLAITYPLPEDHGQRAVMTFALELLAVKVDAANIVIEDDVATLWFPEHLADATTALDKIKAAVQTGLVEPKEFEATRTRRVTELLGRLDSEAIRLAWVADSVDLDAPFTALDQVSAQGFEQFVAAHLDLAHARVFRMQPSGGRPKWRPATLGPPGHNLRGPTSFVVDGWPSFTGATSGALSRARTVKLANGMTAILMPTSPIPIVEISLAFNVGAAAEPEAHRGTAALAVAAIEQMALRAHPDTSWAVGTHSSGADLDTSGVRLRGPSLDVDLLLGQLDGLAHGSFEAADLQKASDEMTKGANAAMQHVSDQSATMRATTFGANHPYGRAKSPTPKDITAFDAKEVEAFYQKYLQPNNATVVVTGGFDPAAVEPLIHQTFDAWTGHGDAAPVQPAHITPRAYAADENRATVALHIVWQGALIDAHYEARYLLANMLDIISSDVEAKYMQRRLGGTYELTAMFDPAMAPQQIAAVLAAIPGIASGDKRSTFAFQSARVRQARWMGGSRGSVSGWTSFVLFGLENGRDTAWLADVAKRAAAVTYADVAELARTELTLDRANISISGPHDAVVAAYAALGVTPTWL